MATQESKDVIDVSEYLNQIGDALNEYQEKEKVCKEDGEQLNYAFYSIGEKLLSVRGGIYSSDVTPVEAKKIFSVVRKQVADKVGRHKSNVDKVVKAADFVASPSYKKYKDKLPQVSSWGTLYLFYALRDGKSEEKDGGVKFKEGVIDEIMQNEEVTATITREKLKEIIDAKAVNTKTKAGRSKTTFIIKHSDGKVDDVKIRALEDALKKIKWEIVKK